MGLELYMFETCPYCRRVISEIESQGRTDVVFRDIRKNTEDYDALMETGGKAQVPCLVIDGKPLYESLDIIEWLKANPQEG